MGKSNPLGLVLDRTTVDDGVFELFYNGLVYRIAL